MADLPLRFIDIEHVAAHGQGLQCVYWSISGQSIVINYYELSEEYVACCLEWAYTHAVIDSIIFNERWDFRKPFNLQPIVDSIYVVE